MTNELNDLVPAQEKLEWVTPKISLMDAEDTEGKAALPFETGPTVFIRLPSAGPS